MSHRALQRGLCGLAVLAAAANGGNGDGVVCGKPLAPQEQAARFADALVPAVFDFGDNDLRGGGR